MCSRTHTRHAHTVSQSVFTLHVHNSAFSLSQVTFLPVVNVLYQMPIRCCHVSRFSLFPLQWEMQWRIYTKHLIKVEKRCLSVSHEPLTVYSTPRVHMRSSMSPPVSPSQLTSLSRSTFFINEP